MTMGEVLNMHSVNNEERETAYKLRGDSELRDSNVPSQVRPGQPPWLGPSPLHEIGTSLS